MHQRAEAVVKWNEETTSVPLLDARVIGIANCIIPDLDLGQYSLLGFKFGSSPLTYATNTGTIPSYLNQSEAQNAINAAFATWDSATSRSLFTNGGSTTAELAKKDNKNVIGFGSLPTGTLATAYVWYRSDTKVVTEFDIVLSTGYNWATNVGLVGDCAGSFDAFDLQAIVAHEIGHPLGLGDQRGALASAQTMYGYATQGELTKRDLARGDKRGITIVYGP